MIKVERISPDSPNLEQLVAEMDSARWSDLEQSWQLDQTKTFLADPNNVWLLAYFDDQVAGVLTGYQLQKYDARQKESLLYEIETKPDFRRQGIGKQLIEAFLELSRQDNSHEAWVLTDADNASARQLYRSMQPSKEESDIIMYTYDLTTKSKEGEK